MAKHGNTGSSALCQCSVSPWARRCQGPVTSTSTSTETISSITATMTSTTINGTTSSTGIVTTTTGFETTFTSGDVPDGETTRGGEPLDDYVPVETWSWEVLNNHEEYPHPGRSCCTFWLSSFIRLNMAKKNYSILFYPHPSSINLPQYSHSHVCVCVQTLPG